MPTTSTPRAAVELDSVSKIYGTFAALRNASLTLQQGTCTMVLGENGAGKSTLLRLVAGLLSPSRGSVKVFGAAISKARGRIGYMSHAPMLYDELSAIENLRYFGNLHVAGAAIACACTVSSEMALRAVGLDPHLTRPVGQYSQGMRQRASLARVLQTDPELLLLDEPFSNLDVDSTQQMVDLLADFRTWPVSGGGGRTIVLTTHLPKLAESLADSTLTMRQGTVLSHTTLNSAQAPA